MSIRKMDTLMKLRLIVGSIFALSTLSIILVTDNPAIFILFFAQSICPCLFNTFGTSFILFNISTSKASKTQGSIFWDGTLCYCIKKFSPLEVFSFRQM